MLIGVILDVLQPWESCGKSVPLGYPLQHKWVLSKDKLAERYPAKECILNTVSVYHDPTLINYIGRDILQAEKAWLIRQEGANEIRWLNFN